MITAEQARENYEKSLIIEDNHPVVVTLMDDIEKYSHFKQYIEYTKRQEDNPLIIFQLERYFGSLGFKTKIATRHLHNDLLVIGW